MIHTLDPSTTDKTTNHSLTETSSANLEHLNFPEIYIMASGKGGVGKTWLSITLVHTLAQQGKKILLFDGDLGLANIDIQLGLTPSRDLGNVLAQQCSLKDAIMPHPSGQFDIIAGRSGCGSLSTLSPHRLNLLREEIKSLAQDYDMIFIDLGAGIGGTVRALSAIATEFIVVTTEEPTALTDAYAFIKLMSQTLPQAPLQVLINQAETTSTATQAYEIIKKVCERFLKITPAYLGSVRRDVRVRESIQSQTLILARHPNAPAGQDVQAIAQELAKKKQNKDKKAKIMLETVAI